MTGSQGDRVPTPVNAYIWMDLFRALAAVLVAISHVRDISWRDSLPADPPVTKMFYFITGFGHIGVIVFFTLSGFWITRSVMRRIDAPAFWTNYMIDRLSRLWIVLIPVIAIGTLADYFGAIHWAFANYSGATGLYSFSDPVSDRLGLAKAFGSAAFLGGILLQSIGSNGPLWSLSYEFWYYIWFPALVLLVRKRKITVALVSSAFALVVPALAYGFLSWLTGALLYFALEHKRATTRSARDNWLAAGGLTLLLAMLVVARISREGTTDVFLAASFAVFLFGLCRIDLSFPKWLRPVARFGSRSSYSLYALHFPLAMLAAGFLTDGMRHEPSPILLTYTLAIVVTLVGIAIAFSHLTEYRTDSVRRWAKNLIANGHKGRSTTTAPPA